MLMFFKVVSNGSFCSYVTAYRINTKHIIFLYTCMSFHDFVEQRAQVSYLILHCGNGIPNQEQIFLLLNFQHFHFPQIQTLNMPLHEKMWQSQFLYSTNEIFCMLYHPPKYKHCIVSRYGNFTFLE